MSDWNGLPDQPERSGWHWVQSKNMPGQWSTRRWVGPEYAWGGMHILSPAQAAQEWNYGCPCPDPSELAQMRKDTERLDWLEKQHFPELRAFDDGFLVATDQVCRSSSMDTARAAIDAAMNAENGNG